MYRISPTLLDSFRIFRDEEYKTEQELQFAIMRKAVPSEKMNVGSAFHKVKAGDGSIVDGLVTVDGITFSAVQESCHELIKEIKIIPIMETTRGLVKIPMVADGIWGNTITEYKTTHSYIDVLRYVDSMQWRCYLWGFSAEKAIYDIYHLEEKDNVWHVKDNQRIDFCPYEKIEKDIERAIIDLIDYCEPRGMLGYITEEEVV